MFGVYIFIVFTHRFNKYLLNICWDAGIILGSRDVAMYKITKSPYQGVYIFIIFTHGTYIESLLCAIKGTVWGGRQTCNQINEVLQRLWRSTQGGYSESWRKRVLRRPQ